MLPNQNSQLSASVPDWDREAAVAQSWNPSQALLRSIRDYQSASGAFSSVRRKIAVLRHRFWSTRTGADIPINSSIGGGLSIPHPNGIVIHPSARIGCNCLIFQQVTIGATSKGVPTIGEHVDIGAGANAVVRKDVPPYGVFVAPDGQLLPPK